MSARWQVLLNSKWTKWIVGAGVLVKVGLLVVEAMHVVQSGSGGLDQRLTWRGHYQRDFPTAPNACPR